MSFYTTGRSARPKARSISRRGLIKTASAAAGLAAGSGAVTGLPTIWALNVKDVTLVHAGPPVAAIPQIGEQASKDLGFTIRMQATENVDLLNRFLSQSSAIDVGIVFIKYVVGRNILQAIPVSKYKYWEQTIPLFTKGVYPDGRKGVDPRGGAV
jgi:putative spermidine/putrescine transport system substrate-binding protein